jgi:hypothetical protein
MERLVVPWFIPRGRSHPWESPGGSRDPRALLVADQHAAVVGAETPGWAAKAIPSQGIDASLPCSFIW